MAGYKLQGKTKDGSMVDIPLTATYDAAGNDIAEQFSKLSENSGKYQITVHYMNGDEWITELPTTAGIEIYQWNGGTGVSKEYLPETVQDIWWYRFAITITTTVDPSDVVNGTIRHLWELVRYNNISSTDDPIKYIALTEHNDTQPKWQTILTTRADSFAVPVVGKVLVNESSFMPVEGTSIWYLISGVTEFEEGLLSLLPNDYDTSVSATWTITALDSVQMQLVDSNGNVWTGFLEDNSPKWSKGCKEYTRQLRVDENINLLTENSAIVGSSKITLIFPCGYTGTFDFPGFPEDYDTSHGCIIEMNIEHQDSAMNILATCRDYYGNSWTCCFHGTHIAESLDWERTGNANDDIIGDESPVSIFTFGGKRMSLGQIIRYLENALIKGTQSIKTGAIEATGLVQSNGGFDYKFSEIMPTNAGDIDLDPGLYGETEFTPWDELVEQGHWKVDDNGEVSKGV